MIQRETVLWKMCKVYFVIMPIILQYMLLSRNLLLGKALIYPLFLYVWIIPRYSDEFYYYRNLGIRRRTLLGVSCAVDFGLCCLLLNYSAALLHAAR